MTLFNLPERTYVRRVIPKNAFDSFTNTNQKKQLSDHIKRISWEHKLSQDTTNLEREKVEEIQVFRVELKFKIDPIKAQDILSIVEKAIPYQLIFYVEYEDEFFISTAVKRPKVDDEDRSIIDWQFTSDWMNSSHNHYKFELKKNLDTTYFRFCKQLTELKHNETATLKNVVEYEKKRKSLKRDIKLLQSRIKNCKQFNKRVELNLELIQKKTDLKNLL